MAIVPFESNNMGSPAMPDPTPLYTSENVKFAYQIRWAMTLFTSGTRPMETTLEPVASALELDGIRVLSYRYAEPSMVQLTLSVKPHISPLTIIQRVKGRLWYAWKNESLIKIDKKYSLRSYGTQERKIIEQYVAGQASHHPMATEKATALFEELTFIDPTVDLARPIEIGNSLLWRKRGDTAFFRVGSCMLDFKIPLLLSALSTE